MILAAERKPREVARVTVTGDGLRFIYSDEAAGLLQLGAASTVRASHVEPADWFGVAGGGWIADMRPSGGPLLGAGDEARDGLAGFATRQAALDAEIAWLRQHRGV